MVEAINFDMVYLKRTPFALLGIRRMHQIRSYGGKGNNAQPAKFSSLERPRKEMRSSIVEGGNVSWVIL